MAADFMDVALVLGGAVALALTAGGALWLVVTPPRVGRGRVGEMEKRRVWRR